MAPSCSPWRNPRILLILLLVFLSGATAGMLAWAVGAHRWVHASNVQTPARSESGKEALVQRLQKELDLAPAQAEQLDMILDDFFTYYHTLQAQLDDVRASGKQRILRILDENQRRKFDQLMSEWQTKQLR